MTTDLISIGKAVIENYIAGWVHSHLVLAFAVISIDVLPYYTLGVNEPWKREKLETLWY